MLFYEETTFLPESQVFYKLSAVERCVLGNFLATAKILGKFSTFATFNVKTTTGCMYLPEITFLCLVGLSDAFIRDESIKLMVSFIAMDYFISLSCNQGTKVWKRWPSTIFKCCHQ